MPSVRVKRGYSFLQDANQVPYTSGSTSCYPRGPIATQDATQPGQTSDIINNPARSLSGSPTQQRESAMFTATRGAASSSGSSRPRRLEQRRPSSRIADHIMSNTRMPLTPLSHISEDRDPYKRQKSGHHRHIFSMSRHHKHEDEDMISLEGPQTDVLVPKGDHEPGRIGSSLSLPHSPRPNLGDWLDDPDGEHHPDDIVEHLDVIDPQIATVATLTNAANAIVIPPVEWYSRKPVVVLPQRRRKKMGKDKESAAEKGDASEDHEDDLDSHVEDVLRKRDRARRVMQGVWSFMKTPLGVITTIYGFLVVFWGTALVFFLARFIDLHNTNTQDFWVEVCQQIETGLFSIPSIGLVPFRVVDTYRVLKVWRYKRKTEKLRRREGLPQLYDPDDLPDPHYDANFVPILTEEEQIDLHYQQHKFMQSQTWYRPHGTQTHRAFPIDTAIWITVMNDLNSVFQCLLSGCMWSLDRFTRPAWTTATTLPLAFVAGIVAGVLIWWGSKKTKRVQEVTDRLMMALAMERRSAVDDIDTLATGEKPRRPTVAGSVAAADGSRVLPACQLPYDSRKPQAKDFVDWSGSSKPVAALSSPGIPQTPLTPATPGIAIADEMVVPPAEDLHGKSPWS